MRAPVPADAASRLSRPPSTRTLIEGAALTPLDNQHSPSAAASPPSPLIKLDAEPLLITLDSDDDEPTLSEFDEDDENDEPSTEDETALNEIANLPRIVLAIDDERKTRCAQFTEVRLLYDGKMIAIIKNIEIYPHRKRERALR